MEKKLYQIFLLLEKKYPWVTPHLLFHYNHIPQHINNPLLGDFGIFKSGMLFLRNIDKFEILPPKDFTTNSILSQVDVEEYVIPNMSNLTKKDVKNFDPIQILVWKGKPREIIDGVHRIQIAQKLNTKIKAIQFKSHSYNNHPSNKEIIRLANEVYTEVNSSK